MRIKILGVQIELETSYFGYPSVKSTLNLWGHYGTKDILKEMGEALNLAAMDTLMVFVDSVLFHALSSIVATRIIT